MKNLTIILLALFSSSVFSSQKADSVLVDKSEKKLYLIANGIPFKSYHVVFGANPAGHKQQEGDERTPEGKYLLDYKKDDSAFYKAIHISYPNQNDIENAKKRGVNPGGFIMIHGQRNGLGWLSFVSQFFNWTNGCIAVTNSEMEEIWLAVDAGTPIEIVQ
ncbi:L,D-transpeptidase family protein [Shewanella xiamenensis]|uniref:L,D-transpeptidase family protein n=1 Tax=Shewanella xiamenensis TaxID=332186 RepID=UPI002E7C251E|nr:L,D-transpeptidase family protein [Shewanella xiamenensis]